jgi:DNA invertase Pin-like site-specific DNA recombinase
VKAVGYIRVSSQEQGESGAGLEAQRRAIADGVAQRGWKLVRVYEDVASGKSTNGRHGLAVATKAIESGEAEALVVAKLDRLSRSLMDFAGLMQRSRRKGWALVALDLGVDTTTPSGEMMANVLAVFAQFERRLIGERTRQGLAVKRSQGVKLGRRPELPESVRRRIRLLHSRGHSLSEIARRLNAGGVATAHGGAQWHASTVKAVLGR